MKKILIIQTAFIGDVILATSLVETIAKTLGNEVAIDMLVRKGNESLLVGHPILNKVYVWDKKKNKYKNLFLLSKQIRKNQYAQIYNLQRFASTGFLTWRSNAGEKLGFKGNPFSFSYNKRVQHEIGSGDHEVTRNVKLFQVSLKDNSILPEKPKLYPSKSDFRRINERTLNKREYAVMAPASVWFTKQLPKEKWIALIQKIALRMPIYLIGAPGDKGFITDLIKESNSQGCLNMAGELSLLESAALIEKAANNYVNDSAPLHLASAMNAKVTAFFCSTIPDFGFGPLSDDYTIVEVKENLDCRPCGLHGHKTCPKGHFKCGHAIDLGQL